MNVRFHYLVLWSIPSWLQVLHSDLLRSRSAFSLPEWIILYRSSKSPEFGLYLTGSVVVMHNESKLSLPDPGSALALCSRLLAVWTPTHTFLSPNLSVSNCKRSWSQIPLRSFAVLVTQGWHTHTSSFEQHKGVFTASCILFCSRAFGFSVSFSFVLFS